MTENFRPTVLRNKAWDALSGKWTQAVVAGVIVFLFAAFVGGIGSLIPFLSLPISLFVTSFISVGGYFVFLDLFMGKEWNLNTIFEPFKDYGRYLIGILLVFVYTFLWSLLLVVPGIIKGISYSQTYFIMRENPSIQGEAAIQQSMAMMDGHKMDYFLLCLSFIGWILLGMITCGIGMIFVMPYMYTALGAFYEEVKKDYAARQMATA